MTTATFPRRFRLPIARGRSKRERDAAPATPTGTVSVKTTVIWLVPDEVVEDVAIVSVPDDAEYVQVAPADKLRHDAETLVEFGGSCTV